MWKYGTFVLLMVTLSFVTVSAEEGFTGPGSQVMAGQVQTVTIVQAKNLPNKSLVILTGSIVQSIGKEKYTFRDATGDIVIDIDRELWALLGVSVGVNDRVEIRGKLDIERRETKIDVKYLKKV